MLVLLMSNGITEKDPPEESQQKRESVWNLRANWPMQLYDLLEKLSSAAAGRDKPLEHPIKSKGLPLPKLQLPNDSPPNGASFLPKPARYAGQFSLVEYSINLNWPEVTSNLILYPLPEMVK